MPEDEILVTALDVAAQELPVDRSAWCIAVGHVEGIGSDVKVVEGDLGRVIEAARNLGFPHGALNYVEGKVVEGRPDYHLATFTAESDGVPQVTTHVGLADGGYAAVATTRHNGPPDEPGETAHVVLADVESNLSDALVWLTAVGLARGHLGPIRVAQTVVSRVPDHPLVLCHVDDETVRTVPGPQRAFEPVVFGFDSSGEVVDAHAALYEVGRRAAEQFDREETQFIVPPGTVTGEDEYPSAADLLPHRTS